MRIQEAISNFTANGQVGPWLRLDVYEPPFDATLAISYGPTSAYTLGIDYALGAMDADGAHQVFISQATTVITVTDGGQTLSAPFGAGLGHCRAVGDCVILTQSPGGDDGVYSIASVVSATSYTLTGLVSQTVSGLCLAQTGMVLQAAATDNIIKLAPVTARASVGVLSPVLAVRLHVTAFTTGGTASLITMQGGASS